MVITWIQRSFRPVRKLLPTPASSFLRCFVTATLTPYFFSVKSGHFRSSLSRKSVSKKGLPLPWYTYPCIDMLSYTRFTGKKILEFGAGHSTLWWGKVASRVVAFEADSAWLKYINERISENTTVHYLDVDKEAQAARVLEIVGDERFDVIVIDGLNRFALIEPSVRLLNENGAIICDNSEGYGFFEGFRDRGFCRVDYYGHAPGVILPHATSIFFKSTCFIFENSAPIGNVGEDYVS
jgi:hypothetical protein